MPMEPIFAETFRALAALRENPSDVHDWMLKRLCVLAAWEGRNREVLPIDPTTDTVMVYNLEIGGNSKCSVSGLEAAALKAGIKTYRVSCRWPELHLVFDTTKP